jgi:hypothetical protein
MKQPNSLHFPQLLDWLEGRLPEAQARAIVERLQTADEATQADLAWLRRFQEIRQSIRFVPPPAEVRDALKRRFEAYAQDRQAPGFFRRLLAELTFDSRTQWAVAGVRSAAGEGLQHQFIYTTEVAEVALNLQPSGADRYIVLTGQVFPIGDIAPNAFSLQLLRGNLEAGLATTDELGEFAFAAVPAGEYDLILSADRFEIVIPAIPLQT